MRGRVHKPGLLAVICIRRAICLRSDSGYPNKKLGAWDFLPPASFFTFFLSGPSLSVTRMSLETNYKKTPKKVVFYKMQLHCDCIAFFLFPLYLLSAQRNRWQAWGLKQKKQTVKKTKTNRRWHSLKPAKCPWHSSGPPQSPVGCLNTDMREL